MSRYVISIVALALTVLSSSTAAPIHDAAHAGNLTALRQILNVDSTMVYRRDTLGATALHYAALGGHHGIIDMLVARGAPVDARDAYGSTPMHYAMRGGPRYPRTESAFVTIDGLEAMYRPGDTINLSDDQSWSNVVTTLIGRGADVNASDRFGATPLHRAAGAGRLLVARTLLLHAEANARDENERTPLFWAVQAGNAQIVVLLFREQADANAVDRDGRTALHFAAMYNKWDIAQILVERGANVSDRDALGLTPRDYAVREGDTRMVELLELRSGE